MNTIHKIQTITVAVALALSSAAWAAGGGAGGGMGPGGGGMGAGPRGPGAGPAASTPGVGPGPGVRAGRQAMARWGDDFTPGWALMTEAERNEHRDRMRAMKSYEECKAFVAQHRQQMAARAEERGSKTLRSPRRDACAALKP